MTFKIQGPVTQGYGNVVNKSGKVLSKISGVEDAMRLRFAGEGLRQAAEDKKLDYLLETYKRGMQPQQGQGGQGGTDWLGLATKGLSIAGGLGAFGGGGFFGGGTTGPDPGGMTLNVNSSNPTPWTGPLFGTPGSMHRI